VLFRAAIGLAVVAGAFVALVIVLAATGLLHLYRVPSSAMEPTLHCPQPASGCEGSAADRIVSLRWPGWSPARGDVVALHTPPLAAVRCGAGGVFVKRVIGLPGERWAERSGVVYIDGKRLEEPYVKPDRRDARTVGPVRIPSGRYFVEGDNRSSSCDSRAWGTVPRKSIVGKIVGTYWPPGRVTIR
jgi:signal peptidase I